MSVEQRKAYINTKSEERKKVQAEIQELSRKRQEYIATKSAGQDKSTMLDAVMIKAIKTQAKSKNLSW
jgi:hypothetical protein